MTKKAFHENRYDSIQALRGLTALFIILEHIRYLNCGAFGVDIFFIISGFMILFSTHQGPEHFLSKRLIRLLPLYYFMTLGTFSLLKLFPGMFEQTKANPIFLVKSLLFLPFDIGNGVLQPLLRIGWTVNCEMFFYLLFWIAMKISFRYRGIICSLFIIILVLAGKLCSLPFAPLLFFSDPVMLDFIWGILSYYLAKAIYQRYQQGKITRALSTFSMIFALLILVELAITKHSVNLLGLRRILLWELPCLLVVLCFFVAGLHLRFSALLVKLGNISFSLYLFHYYPILFFDRKIFDFSTCTPRSLFGSFLAILLCILIAGFSHRFIEVSLGNTLKAKWFSIYDALSKKNKPSN